MKCIVMPTKEYPLDHSSTLFILILKVGINEFDAITEESETIFSKSPKIVIIQKHIRNNKIHRDPRQ